jgi:DNA-binding transcriptional MerR regulator
MKPRRTYQVKELARIAGISVRALHHYDAIGLLVPTARSASGYRLYDDDDVIRLQQIIVARELGLALEEIQKSLDDPSFDRRQALLSQRTQLTQRAEETAAMIAAVDCALSLMDTEDKENSMDMKRLFNGFDTSKYDEEAKQRWGHTDAYKESTRRVQRYSAEDWQRFGAEQAAIYGDAFSALQAGKAPDSPGVMAIAERHRLSIDRWFYPCSVEMHEALALGYAEDARFAENIDKYGAGLTPFLVAAIRANSQQRRAP